MSSHKVEGVIPIGCRVKGFSAIINFLDRHVLANSADLEQTALQPSCCNFLVKTVFGFGGKLGGGEWREGVYIFCGYCNLSRVMRKPTFCICENKDAHQLRGTVCPEITVRNLRIITVRLQ